MLTHTATMRGASIMRRVHADVVATPPASSTLKGHSFFNILFMFLGEDWRQHRHCLAWNMLGAGWKSTGGKSPPQRLRPVPASALVWLPRHFALWFCACPLAVAPRACTRALVASPVVVIPRVCACLLAAASRLRASSRLVSGEPTPWALR